MKASASHVAAGGKEWDTVKPLHKWFKHLDRVLLMDDDAYKVWLGSVAEGSCTMRWPVDVEVTVVLLLFMQTALHSC